MAKCRGCGEEIIFIKSPAGKFIPCTVGADDDTSKAVGVGYIPHWSTCKAANQFRNRRKKEIPLESSLF